MDLLFYLVILLIVGAIASTMSWSRVRDHKLPKGHLVLRYGLATQTLVTGGGLFSAIAAAQLYILRPDLPYLHILASLLTAVFALLGAEVWASKVILRDGGMVRSSLFRPKRFLLWKDVASVRLTTQLQIIEVRTRPGESARVPVFLTSIGALARDVLRDAPPEAIDPASKPVLERLRARWVPV